MDKLRTDQPLGDLPDTEFNDPDKREENLRKIHAQTRQMYMKDALGIDTLHNQVMGQIGGVLDDDTLDDIQANNDRAHKLAQPLGTVTSNVLDSGMDSDERQSWEFAQRIKEARVKADNELRNIQKMRDELNLNKVVEMAMAEAVKRKSREKK
jgi:hypothetical protein